MKLIGNHLLFVMALASFITLSFSGGDHDHGHGHGHGHGHHDTSSESDEHKSERPGVSLTLFSEHSELFLEFPIFIQGKESLFLAHLTHLHNAKPFTKGRVTVLLRSEGEADESFRVEQVARDGIFIPLVVPRVAGKREVSLYLQTAERTEVFELGEHKVYASESEIPVEQEEANEHLISFLKEQQWKTDFGIEQTQSQTFHETIQLPAKILAANHALSSVKNPLGGQLTLVRVKQYQKVKTGEPIAELKANPEFTINYFNLEAKHKLLKAELEFHRAEAQRFSRLLNQQSASQTELLKSRLEVQKLELQVDETNQQLSHLKDSLGIILRQNSIFIPMNAPQDGVVQSISGSLGDWLEAHREIFKILHPESLNLHIYLPLSQKPFKPAGIKLRSHGTEAWLDGLNLLEMKSALWSGAMDPVAKYQTLSIPFQQAQLFHSGQNLEVELSKSNQLNGIKIPLSALSVEQGNSYVYVQVNGENFERRAVKTGYQMAEAIVVVEGLKEAEWIVTKGVYNLRLASASDQVPAHGHAH